MTQIPEIPSEIDFKQLLEWVTRETGFRPHGEFRPWRVAELAVAVQEVIGTNQDMLKTVSSWFYESRVPVEAHLEALIIAVLGRPKEYDRYSNLRGRLRRCAFEARKRSKPGQATDEAKEIFLNLRKRQDHLRRLAANHYLAVSDPILGLPTKPEWIPSKPIPLAQIDKALAWDARPNRTKHRSMPATEGTTFSDFVADQFPNIQQDNWYCYRLMSVSGERDAPVLTFAKSRYHDLVDTCQRAAFDLSAWDSQKGNRREISELPLRKAQAIFDFSNRDANPGVSTVVILKNRKPDTGFLIHDRKWNGAMDSPNSYHVVPAGQFQPDQAENYRPERDFSLVRNVFREMAEELYSVPHAAEPVVFDDQDFMKADVIAPIREAYENGALTLHYLGLAIDPLPMKPGILAAMVIDVARMPKGSLTFTPNLEGRVIEESVEELPRYLKRPIDKGDPNVIPDGVACLTLAQRHLEFLLDQ